MLYQKDPKTGEGLSDENIRYNVRTSLCGLLVILTQPALRSY